MALLLALILGYDPQLSHFLLPLSLPQATAVSHLDHFKSLSAGLNARGQSDPLSIDILKCEYVTPLHKAIQWLPT